MKDRNYLEKAITIFKWIIGINLSIVVLKLSYRIFQNYEFIIPLLSKDALISWIKIKAAEPDGITFLVGITLFCLMLFSFKLGAYAIKNFDFFKGTKTLEFIGLVFYAMTSFAALIMEDVVLPVFIYGTEYAVQNSVLLYLGIVKLV